MKILAIVLSGLTLIGCASGAVDKQYSRVSHTSLFQALDSMPDGTQNELVEKLGTFRIISTHANSERLCRLVEIRTGDEYVGESFCKAKGGEWR
jgi:hypothetical protein